MLKAEADNSYLDLDYSGLIEEVISFIKTVSRKTIKLKICFI